MIKAEYIEHSGFAVHTDNAVLIFDYYDPKHRHDIKNIAGADKPVYVFVSHSHPDHYDKKIFDLRKYGKVKYILSDDVKAGNGDDIIYLKPDNEYTVDGVTVKTLKSTDEGCAFLVNIDGITVYHAGDLNWWHWNGESEEYNRQMGKDYCAETDKLKGIPIDIAFIPLDGRLEDKYLLGMDYAMKTLDIKKAFPMHFWNDFSLSRRLKADGRSRAYRDRITDIDRQEQIFEI